jgi:hypothetical protein
MIAPGTARGGEPEVAGVSRFGVGTVPRKPESAHREAGRFPRGALPLAGKVFYFGGDLVIAARKPS